MLSKYHVSPYAFNYDNYVLVFRCTEVEDGFYKVIIDEIKKTEKLIPVPQKHLIFETWPEHIIKRAAAVDFSPKKNPLKSDTSSSAKNLAVNKEQFFHPVEIKGHWLKIRDDNGLSGWIKWRNDKGELLIEIYYDM